MWRHVIFPLKILHTTLHIHHHLHHELGHYIHFMTQYVCYFRFINFYFMISWWCFDYFLTSTCYGLTRIHHHINFHTFPHYLHYLTQTYINHLHLQIFKFFSFLHQFLAFQCLLSELMNSQNRLYPLFWPMITKFIDLISFVFHFLSYQIS